MTRIGIYHQIDLEGLDLAAQLSTKGVQAKEIRDALVALAARLGVTKATALKRTQVAKSAWSDSESAIVRLAADLYGKASDDEKLALHVGVVIRKYPFFLDVLEQVGTQFQLNGEARQSTIRKRIERKYGSKANAYQGVQKALQTLVSWNGLSKGRATGLYIPVPRRPIGPDIAEVLLAAILEAESRSSGPFEELRHRAGTFLFDMPPESSWCALLKDHTDGSGRRVVALVLHAPASGSAAPRPPQRAFNN